MNKERFYRKHILLLFLLRFLNRRFLLHISLKELDYPSTHDQSVVTSAYVCCLAQGLSIIPHYMTMYFDMD
jgi:hypothetical protein